MTIIVVYKDEYNKEPKELFTPDDTKILHFAELAEVKEIVVDLEKGKPTINLDMLRKKEKEDENSN